MSVQVVSFNCLLKNAIGHTISETFNREVLTSVEGENLMLKGLVEGMQNLTKGEKRSIALSAHEAYGLYDPQKVVLISRNKLPKETQLGQQISVLGKEGQIKSYRVLEFHADTVSLDGNHPLAGQDLVFEIEALDVRDATADEIAESSTIISEKILH